MEAITEGLIAVGEVPCAGCGRIMRYPERYGYRCEAEGACFRLCEDCCRARGYLQRKKDERGHEEETFLF